MCFRARVTPGSAQAHWSQEAGPSGVPGSTRPSPALEREMTCPLFTAGHVQPPRPHAVRAGPQRREQQAGLRNSPGFVLYPPGLPSFRLGHRNLQPAWTGPSGRGFETPLALWNGSPALLGADSPGSQSGPCPGRAGARHCWPELPYHPWARPSLVMVKKGLHGAAGNQTCSRSPSPSLTSATRRGVGEQASSLEV